MQSGHLSKGYIDSMEQKIKKEFRFTLKLPVIFTAASLAHHGVLCFKDKKRQDFSLKNVDLGSIPNGQLGSLAACIEDPTKGNIQNANSLRIENVTNCDFIGLMDNVKIVDLFLAKMTLFTEETKSLVRAMNSGRIRWLMFGKEGEVTLDINTILVQYKGEGKCTRIQALGENAKKYRNDIKKLAMQIGWIVKKDYDDEMEIIRK